VFAPQRGGGVVRRRDRIDGRVEVQPWGTDYGMTNHSQAGLGRRETRSSESDTVDLGAAIAAVSRQAQRAAVLRMLTGADDCHRHGIAFGVLDRLVVNHDAHAPSTVANGPLAARVFPEWIGQAACDTTPMDPLTFHREALDVAQRVVDEIDRSQFELPTPCDEWNVRQVLEHMIGGNRRIAGDPPGAGEDVIGDDLSAAYAASAASAIAMFEAPGGLDRNFTLSWGNVPGQVAVLVRSTDQLAHAWDLAKATGMPTDLSPAMFGAGLELLQYRFALMGRNSATYADERQAPAGASVADRFAAFAGRQP
jgi:uncharacterized protein (TIGR03086 family)